MIGKGWISIHRKLRECWIWDEKPFDRTHAWLDILLSTNFEEKKVNIGSKLIHVERGSFITSELKLMERWGWSKSKVRNFLKLLQSDEMIIVKADRQKTTITVVNYNVYQDYENHEKTTEGLQKNYEETTERLQKDTTNNINNINNSNNDNNDNIISITPGSKESIPYQEIIDYLNLKVGTSYKASTKKTRELINARWKEKFTLDDFKAVIDHKVEDWKGKFDKDGKPLGNYLRPETLFGSKFEGYLNQKGGGKYGQYSASNKPDQGTKLKIKGPTFTAEEDRELEEFEKQHLQM